MNAPSKSQSNLTLQVTHAAQSQDIPQFLGAVFTMSQLPLGTRPMIFDVHR